MTNHKNLMPLACAFTVFALCTGCTTETNENENEGENENENGESPTPTRFRLEVNNDIQGSVFVQLNDQDGEIAWVTVRRGGDSVFLTDRNRDCPIADQARVRDVTDGDFTGSIELNWNRYEYRDCDPVLAQEGEYTATFCFAGSATLQPGGGEPAAAEGAAGTINDPFCVDVDFALPGDTEVLYEIVGG